MYKVIGSRTCCLPLRWHAVIVSHHFDLCVPASLLYSSKYWKFSRGDQGQVVTIAFQWEAGERRPHCHCCEVINFLDQFLRKAWSSRLLLNQGSFIKQFSMDSKRKTNDKLHVHGWMHFRSCIGRLAAAMLEKLTWKMKFWLLVV